MIPPAPDAPFTPGEGPPPKRRASERGADRGRRAGSKKGFWWVFLLANALPAAAIVYWFTRPVEVREKFKASIPPGVASRAIAAGIALMLLVVLAKLVLPGARAAVHRLTEVGARFRALPRGKRILAFPLEAGLDFGWMFAQVLFALDVIAIFACGAAFVLYAVRIVKPELFPFLPG